MLPILFSVSVSSIVSEPTQVEVVSVDRASVYAGRRGQRVSESWTVKVDGRTATIEIFPYHTKVGRTPAFVQTGDRVVVKIGAHQSKLKATIGEIRVLD